MSSAVSYEKNDVNVKVMGIIAFLLVVLIAGFVILLDDYFVYNVEKVEVREERPNPELISIRQQADEQLSGYGIVDKEKGLYKIPIDQAIKVVISEYAH
ncbi:MAG TPA: hypothetical protein ENJ15_07355 [Caldithrix abyssi]|uniref:Uncharacterized protein n=1 Tax=Caldithrix abyssi TaxID=187145 RepID=A0A7V5RQA9_CALAY|nr:hypothetical protein [Caldithrix abyssi]